MNLAFFPCCISSAFLEQYETATRVVMAELGIEVQSRKDFNCCGYPLKGCNYGAYIHLSAKNLALSETAFALKGSDIGVADEAVAGRCVFILQRAGTMPADRAEYDKNKEQIAGEMLQQKQVAAVGTWLKDVRRRANPSEGARRYLDLLPEWGGEAAGGKVAKTKS